MLMLLSFSTHVSFASDVPETTKESDNKALISLGQTNEVIFINQSENYFTDKDYLNTGTNAEIPAIETKSNIRYLVNYNKQRLTNKIKKDSNNINIANAFYRRQFIC